jgi:hypothetical protein
MVNIGIKQNRQRRASDTLGAIKTASTLFSSINDLEGIFGSMKNFTNDGM